MGYHVRKIVGQLLSLLGRLRKNQVDRLLRGCKTGKRSKVHIICLYLLRFRLLFRLNQKTIHQLHPERGKHRIHHLLATRFPDNHEITPPGNILVKINFLRFRHCLPHLGDNQDIDIRRNLPVQRHVLIIESLVHQRLPQHRQMREHTIIPISRTVRFTFPVTG